MKIVVVGAGIGGLVAGLELAHGGHDVTIVEAQNTPGGKMRTVDAGGAAVNAGPTVFTMRWVFDALFADLGLDFAAHVKLRPLDVIARHAWTDGTSLDLFADHDRSADAIGAFAGLAAKREFLAFAELASRLYDTLWPTFIGAEKPSALGLVGRIARHDPAGLALVNPQASLWQTLGRLFTDPRLRQLFARYATYCGSSPFSASSTLMVVADVEQRGVWQVEGGMAALARALAALATSAGATLHLSTPVSRIEAGRNGVTGVVTQAGERIGADAVICNADAAAIATGRFGPDVAGAVSAAGEHTRSLSAVTFAARTTTRGFPLSRHTVFFSEDYAAEFAALFRKRQIPDRPTVYICAEDRDDGAADAGESGGSGRESAERLLCLVNAPPTGDRLNLALAAAEIQRCQADMLNLLADCGLTLDLDPASTVVTTPADFSAMFPATGGALYGRNVHGWNATFQRPSARTRIPGLYLAGGSVHPGPGVPMAALSGRLAARALTADRASIRPFRRVAMPGGTSTR